MTSAKASLAADRAQRQAEALQSRYPADDALRRQLADIHLNAGSVLRVAGDHAASLAENSKALTIQSLATHPDDGNLRFSLADAYQFVGMTEVRLGKLKAGLHHYQLAVSEVEHLAALDPSNASYQHELLLAYGHLADVTGSPYMPSLGDTAGAVAIYKQGLGIAQRLYQADPADQRLANDYGVTLSRVAGALPVPKCDGIIGRSEPRGAPEVSRPLEYRGRVYVVTSGGIVSCMETKTGTLIYRRRINAPGGILLRQSRQAARCSSHRGKAWLPSSEAARRWRFWPTTIWARRSMERPR